MLIFKKLIVGIRTINHGPKHEVMIESDDEPVCYQRKEWIDYILQLASEAEEEIKQMSGSNHHTESIVCPKCRKTQCAKVLHTVPWWTYIHHCECGFIIGEDQWLLTKEVENEN